MKKFHWKIGQLSLSLENLWQHPKSPKGKAKNQSLFIQAEQKLKEKFKSKKVGFYDWPSAISKKELDGMKALASRLQDEFDAALLFGIGGSYLGAATVLQALRSGEAESSFPFHWVSNVDSSSIEAAEFWLEHRRAATVVISKSGNTTETLSAFFHLSSKLDSKGFVVITDPEKGELRRLANKNGWSSFAVPPNIGGRFSVLTSVGLFPCLLGGLSADELLQGAIEVRTALEKTDAAENPAYWFAYTAYLWDTLQQHPIQYLMPYRSNLRLLSDWYVQLWAESLGKRTLDDTQKSVGFTPVAALGTSDQHSLLQLFKQGPQDKIIGFLDVAPGTGPKIRKPRLEVPDFEYLFGHSFDEISSLACLATEKSLQLSGVPTYRIELGTLNAKAVGGLLFFFEVACAFAGELYGVDAFSQPGVEESKKLLRQSL